MRTLRSLDLAIVCIAISACSEEPADSIGCSDEQTPTVLQGYELEPRGDLACITKNVVTIGEYCLENQQFGEENDEYTDDDAWLGLEPHNMDAVRQLEAEGFRKIEAGDLLSCEAFDTG